MNPVHPSYNTFGRRALANRFAVLVKEIDTVKAYHNIDSIHDIRVASRRFHAAAQLFPDCIAPSVLTECERTVRKIRKSAGALRDCDVQKLSIERIIGRTTAKQYHAGMRRLIVRLEQQRNEELPRLLSAIHTFEKRSIRAGMEHALSSPGPNVRRSQTLRQRAVRNIVVAIGNILEYDQCTHQSTAVEELHDMRIAAKRLRYIMEIYSPLYSEQLKPFIGTVRSLQDHLGFMHDCDVWLQQLPSFIEKERKRTMKYFGDTIAFPRIERGIIHLMTILRAERNSHYHTFLRLWKKTQKEDTWNKLTELVAHSRAGIQSTAPAPLRHIVGGQAG